MEFKNIRLINFKQLPEFEEIFTKKKSVNIIVDYPFHNKEFKKQITTSNPNGFTLNEIITELVSYYKYLYTNIDNGEIKIKPLFISDKGPWYYTHNFHDLFLEYMGYDSKKNQITFGIGS